MTVSLDANLFIYVLNADPIYGPDALDLLKRVEKGELHGVASELVYLEVLSGSNLKPSGVEQSKRLLDVSSVKYKPININILMLAADLRRRHGVKTPDSIHLATALFARAEIFVTNDQRLIKLPINGLKIIGLSDIWKQFG